LFPLISFREPKRQQFVKRLEPKPKPFFQAARPVQDARLKLRQKAGRGFGDNVVGDARLRLQAMRSRGNVKNRL